MKQPFVQFGALSVLLTLGAGSVWYLSHSSPDKEPATQGGPQADARSPLFKSPPATGRDQPAKDTTDAARPAVQQVPKRPTEPLRTELTAGGASAGSPPIANPFLASDPPAADETVADEADRPDEADRVALTAFPPPPADGESQESDPLLARGQEPRQLQPTPASVNPLRAAAGRIAPTAPQATEQAPASPLGAEPAGSAARQPFGEGAPPTGLAAPRGLGSTAPAASPASPQPRGGWGTVGPRGPAQMAQQPTPAPRPAAGLPAANPSPRNEQPRIGYQPATPQAAPPRVAADPTPRGREPVAPRSYRGNDAEGTGQPGEISLEGPQHPQLIVEKFAPAEIQVGKQAVFEIVVKNTGQQTATNVVVVDVVPQGTQLVATTPRASQVDGADIVWEAGDLPPGEERVFEVQLLPVTEGDLGSVAQVHFTAEASIRTRCTRPELEITTTAARKVLIGEDQVLNIQLHNPGTGDATGVILLENVPTELSHSHGPSLELEIGTLRAGETRQLELVLQAEQAGLVRNQLVARADANLTAESVAEFEIVAPAIEVAVDGPRRRYLDRPATYTLEIHNPGTATAREIELVSHLPKGMEFVRANNMGEYDPATHSVYWSLAELPPNEDAPVELVMLPVSEGTQTMEVESHGELGISDRAAQDIEVEGIAAIKFEVVDVADPIEVGGETTYEINVVNQGSGIATNVQVHAVLPRGITAVAAAGPTQHEMGQGEVWFAPLDKLSPKADVTYRVDVQGTAPGDQRFRVQIVTDQVQQPITKEESTHVYADE